MSLLEQANKYFREKDYIQAYKLYLKAKSYYDFHFLNYNIDLCKKQIDKKDLGPVYLESKSLLDECILRLESVDNGIISGWSINKVNPNNTVILETLINEKPYSIIEATSQRKDVQKIYGGDGFSGFRSEINKYVTFSNTSLLRVSPLSNELNDSSIKTNAKLLPSLLHGQHFDNSNEKAKKLAESFLVDNTNNTRNTNIRVSVIILNLNGSEVLRECLKSLLKYNSNVEIIIIDHASTDNSIEMIESFNNEKIIVIKRDKNYSYSESNNLGASKASGEILIFLNNDIVLTSDSISYMADTVSSTDFGLLGIKLWDLPKSKNFILDENIKVNQHLGVHFNCISRKETIEAFELRNSAFVDLTKGILETPAVTAAMMAVSKADFFKIGGFSKKYFYGQEDVDFCLRYSTSFSKKTGVVLEHGAYHIRGLSRKGLSKKNKSYINDNRQTLQSELGADFRKKFRQEKILKPGFWNHKPTAIAMIVSEVSMNTSKADFFTAKELGDVFDQDEKYTVGYFDTSSDYDMSGYDIVIVYIDGFNPEKLKNISPSCQLIAWARNWFDRWCERPWIEMYDIIYASSEYARNYMEKRLKRKVNLLRIAASTSCINVKVKEKKYESDYVFTGSYFNSPREITNALKPETIPFKFKLFGYNWETHEQFKNYTSGSVSYEDIPKVYAETKLVIDDANIATKKWGALNCRIYDALASGTLCITNNEIGIKEIFDEDFPFYEMEDLNSKITNLLKDEKNRSLLSEKYKKVILEKHTYYNRKLTILKDVKENLEKDAIAIKIAAPDFTRAVNWGDYYFAIEIRKELELLGYKVRIDCLKEWNGTRSLSDDINIVLRGLSSFKPRTDQLNILWVISHPDLINESELKNYNHIFIASKKYTEKLTSFLEVDNISYLPQASAFNINDLDQKILEETPSHEILFIGNSRNEYREVVKWCVEKNFSISIYGGGWDGLVPNKYIKGSFVDNELLPYYYSKAKLVLNDHWADMKKNGFISNRVYDVLAVGGTLITDYVVGMEDIKNKNLYSYKNKKDFLKIVKKLLTTEKENMQIIKTQDFSFKTRVLNLKESF